MEYITAQDFINNRAKRIKDGLSVKMRDIGRASSRIFTIEAATFLICKHLNEKKQPFKIFVLERLKAIKPSGKVSYNTWENKKTVKHPNIEYRFGYYIIGKNGNKLDKWTWGQYCPMIGHTDFVKLMKKAYKERTIL